MQFLRLLVVSVCLVLPVSAGAWGEGWGERSPDPYEELWNRYDFSAPTAREPVDPYDYLPYGHEEQAQREYNNRQRYNEQVTCALMFDANPAAKEMCLKGLGR